MIGPIILQSCFIPSQLLILFSLGFYLKAIISSGICLSSMWKVRLQEYNKLGKDLMAYVRVWWVRQGSTGPYMVGLSEKKFKKTQEGLRKFTKIQEGLRRFNKVQGG